LVQVLFSSFFYTLPAGQSTASGVTPEVILRSQSGPFFRPHGPHGYRTQTTAPCYAHAHGHAYTRFIEWANAVHVRVLSTVWESFLRRSRRWLGDGIGAPLIVPFTQNGPTRQETCQKLNASLLARNLTDYHNRKRATDNKTTSTPAALSSVLVLPPAPFLLSLPHGLNHHTAPPTSLPLRHYPPPWLTTPPPAWLLTTTTYPPSRLLTTPPHNNHSSTPLRLCTTGLRLQQQNYNNPYNHNYKNNSLPPVHYWP